jgi:hypothetical protein
MARILHRTNFWAPPETYTIDGRALIYVILKNEITK